MDELGNSLEVPDHIRTTLRTALEKADVVEHRYESDVAHDDPTIVSIAATESGVRVNGYDSTHRYATPEEVIDHHAPFVTDWFYWDRIVGGRETPGRAFLRWLEGADVADRSIATRYDDLWEGMCRTWGQLAVSVERDRNGNRRYELRHIEDLDAEPESLEQIDLFELPALARTDTDGDYRPLRGSETLRRGWRLLLDASGIVQAVDDVYPASIATWYRDRTGRLEPVSFRETADRQSGHLQCLANADRTDVEAVIRDRCDNCLKNRAWRFEDATDSEDCTESVRDDQLVCPEACAIVRMDVRRNVVDDSSHDHGDELEMDTSDHPDASS